MRSPMGSVGDCFDNAIAASFLPLECELLKRRSFKTQVEVRQAVFDFVKGWYNPHRRHFALSYQSPIDYERYYSTDAKQSGRCAAATRTAGPPKNPAVRRTARRCCHKSKNL